MCFIILNILHCPVLLATVIVAMGSAMVPYWTIIFLRLALHQLRDHVQHPLPLPQHHSPHVHEVLSSLSATERVGR